MRKMVYGRWYMVASGWVKNVNKLRINSSVTSALSSPAWVNTIATHPLVNVQLQVVHQSVHFFTQRLSTVKIALSYLSFVSFPYYPHPLLLEPLKKI